MVNTGATYKNRGLSNLSGNGLDLNQSTAIEESETRNVEIAEIESSRPSEADGGGRK